MFKAAIPTQGSPRRRSAVLTAALLAVLGAGLRATPPAPLGPPIGININYAGDWVPDLLFADAFMENRGFTLASGSPAPVDANGWPTVDAKVYVWAGQTLNMSGTYALSFVGQANVACTGGTVSNQVYNAATNVTTATVTMTNADLNMAFTNTQRTASSGTNTGVTNVKLMRPTSYGAGTSYPTSAMFTTLIKGLIGNFGTVRFMDYLATNGNLQVNWSDRVPPTYSSAVVANSAYGWEGEGSPWEYAVMLCNETNSDMWINLPVGATDTYVTDVANLIAYGSDGLNPYTGVQGNPAYPPLNPGLNVYVEFSNEVWNTGFPQSQTNYAAAGTEVAAGGSPLNFDADPNQWNWAARRSAKRTVEISNLFRAVFGNAAMMSRIRPVLESQEGYAAFWLLQQTHMLEDYYNNATFVATPHPPSYYVYGGGGSAYYNPDDSSASLTLSNIWTSDTFDTGTWAPVCQSDSGYDLAVYGRRVAYEGGPSLDNTGNSEAIKSEAWADPDMTTCVVDHQTTWNQNGGGLVCYFNSTGSDYQWAFTHDPAVLNSPKMLAVQAINGSAPAVGTYGTAIPGQITASTYTSPESWAGSNPKAMAANGTWTWTGYVVSTAATQAFSVNLSAGSSGTANTADLYIDGADIGTIAIPNTGSSTTFQASPSLVTGVLLAGTHGVLLKATAGAFGVSTINFSANTAAAPAFTTQPISAVVTGGTVALNAGASGASAYQWILNGTTPIPGANGPLLVFADAAAAVGSYTCIAANQGGSATSSAATVSLASTSDIGRLVNISCRALSEAGSNQLIAGYVIGGQGTSGLLPVLIRASGPALANFGVSGTLADPKLTLNKSNSDGTSTVIGTDSGWGGNAAVAAAASEVGAFAWTASTSLDSALVQTLSAGDYTAQVTGASGDSGVALAEVYDATPSGTYTPSQSRLINISARVEVGTGGNILIAGFVIGGTTSRTVLIRGSGPILKAFGLTGVLPDPQLSLFQSVNNASTLIETNTGWGGSAQIAAAAASVGAFSWGSSATPDSAILVTLPPGSYTAQVAGASGDTGVALVEVYEVP
jgi:hypothetical protein